MFYLLPCQRRRKKWFPEVVYVDYLLIFKKSLFFFTNINLSFRYYYADIDITREKIKQMIDDKKWNNKFPEMKQNLLKILNIEISQDNDTLLQELLKRIENLKNTK